MTTDELRLLSEKQLGITKPNTLFINTARGAMVDTKALVDVLNNGHLG